MSILQKPTLEKTAKIYWVLIASISTFGFLTAIRPASAFSVTYNFTVQITSNTDETQGLLNGTTAQGSFTYDDTHLTNIGSEYVSGSKGNLTLQFKFLNQLYTEKDDLNYGNNSYLYDYPTAFFKNGILLGLDFLVAPSWLQPPREELGFRIFNNTFYTGATNNFNSGSPVGTVAYGIPSTVSDPVAPSRDVVAVPEPSEIGGAIVAFSVLSFWIRKAKIRG